MQLNLAHRGTLTKVKVNIGGGGGGWLPKNRLAKALYSDCNPVKSLSERTIYRGKVRSLRLSAIYVELPKVITSDHEMLLLLIAFV